jgi:hypothetical protein
MSKIISSAVRRNAIRRELYQAWFEQYVGRGNVNRIYSAMGEALEYLSEDDINAIMDQASHDTEFYRKRKYRRSR